MINSADDGMWLYVGDRNENLGLVDPYKTSLAVAYGGHLFGQDILSTLSSFRVHKAPDFIRSEKISW